MFSELAIQVQRTIIRNDMLTPEDRVLVGVSGGADSVCLLLVLKELGHSVAAAHLHHGLRGKDADEDAEFTKKLAERLDVPFFGEQISLPEREFSGNLEAAGRAARRGFFNEVVQEYGFTKIALAHTRTDRIETFLLNLLRGSGPEGLVSMAPVSGTIIRPLIDRTRQEIEGYLKQRNQTWRTDRTNFDVRFARNRLRRVVVPVLKSDFNSNLTDTLARTIRVLQDEDAWMRSVTHQWLRDFGDTGTHTKSSLRFSPAEKVFSCDANMLRSQPIALIRRVIREALREVGCDLNEVSFNQVEAARSLLQSGKSGKCIQIPGGFEVAREFGRLVFRRATRCQPDYEYELKIPGQVHIRELEKLFRAEVVENVGRKYSPQCIFVDADSLGPCVKIRNWRVGDYYRPVGLPAGKIKKLFQRVKIPKSHRKSWPVVVVNSTIVWVASFPVSREFVPGKRSQRLVVIEALPL